MIVVAWCRECGKEIGVGDPSFTLHGRIVCEACFADPDVGVETPKAQRKEGS